MSRMQGRVAIVTGAAQGLGAAFAKRLAEEGAAVVIADIEDGGEAVAAIHAATPGARLLDVQTDISDESACQALIEKTVDHFGSLDVLVNNAKGRFRYAPFDELTTQDWDAMFAVAVRGTFLCTKAAAPVMRARQYGKVINLASGTVFKGAAGMLHYVSAKGALVAMTRSMSRELGGDGICVNALAPGLTLSKIIAGNAEVYGDAVRAAMIQSRALKRDEVPTDLTGALLFLASADSDFMTGQCLVVDGGSVNH
jgi:NAD(P)-dependent dehydrogenase (short-subunit alcohol dehydrogenase family)